MQRRVLPRQAQDMATRVPAAIEQAALEIAPSLKPSACTLSRQLEQFVSSTTRKLAARITATP